MSLPLFSERELEKLTRACQLVLEAEDRLPVLRTLAWDRELAETFFANGARELPRPEYPVVDPAPGQERIEAARALLDGSSAVHDWLRRFADATDVTGALLQSTGTSAFFTLSEALYGSARTPLADGNRTALDLAIRLDDMLSGFEPGRSKLESPARLGAHELKAALDAQLPLYFGEDPPKVTLSDTLSAKATASREGIRLRMDAAFSDLDIDQLLQHEALIHIATGRNGAAQTRFPILAESFPGNTRTQEGLAVFAEFISGALDPRRFRRLANRTIAIAMAADGADFIELYHFFRERSDEDAPYEAFENARRVVRGGRVDGGAPFTKDSVYLGGLIEVHNYLRTAIRAGDAAHLRLLFVGKIDLADLEAMAMLRDAGLIAPPRIVPPWISDLRHLVSYLAYSTFLNEIDLADVSARYRHLFETGGDDADGAQA